MIAQNWIKQDSSDAFTWAISLNDYQARGNAVAVVASFVAQNDPEKALTLLQDAGLPNIEDRATLNVLKTWAHLEPERAAAWVTTMPANTFRESAADAVSSKWRIVDPQRAEEWLSKIRPSN